MINVTDSKKRWRLLGRQLINVKTNESIMLSKEPNSNNVAIISEEQFHKKCQIAFNTGVWPD